MNKEELLSENTFLELLKLDQINRARREIELSDIADSLRIKPEFNKLLKAYRATGTKPVTQDKGHNVFFDMKNTFHRFKEGKPVSIIDKKLAEYIIENQDIFVMGGMAYIYANGVFLADENETKLKAIIQGLIYEDLITIDAINRIYRLIIAQDTLQRDINELNKYPKHWINFKNFMFDVKEWKSYEHSPQYLSINQVPHSFNPDTKPVGENVESFVNYAIQDSSDREMLYQYYGYCMTTDSSLQRFLILTGAAGTGKSQLIHIIEEIVGSKNISNISLEQLNERFFPSSLLGKTLNTNADIDSKALEKIDGIKKATGEDMLVYEKKGRDAIFFKSYAKLLFSANEIPVSISEKSEAIYRRMLIIRVDNKPQKADANLWNKLQKEIDYVIYQSVCGLQKLYADGGINISENSRRNVTDLYEQADNVLAFINDKLEKNAVKRVKQSELYKSYTEYCNETGRNPVTVFGFNKNLRNKGYSTVQIHGNTHYVGLGYKDTNFVEVSQNEDLPFV